MGRFAFGTTSTAPTKLAIFALLIGAIVTSADTTTESDAAADVVALQSTKPASSSDGRAQIEAKAEDEWQEREVGLAEVKDLYDLRGVSCSVCKGLVNALLKIPGLKIPACAVVSVTKCPGGCYNTCKAAADFVTRFPRTSAFAACKKLGHCSFFGR